MHCCLNRHQSRNQGLARSGMVYRCTKARTRVLQESILQSLRSDRDVHQDRAGHPHLGRGRLPGRGLPSMLECKVRQPLVLPSPYCTSEEGNCLNEVA